ncbi:MAG: VOC family protein [Pseudomonadota bacterium]
MPLYAVTRFSATLAQMFVAVSPVCPTTDLPKTIAFWQALGFRLVFADHSDLSLATYAGVQRETLELHLQTFTADQIQTTQTMATRIRLQSRDALEKLYAEWQPQGFISAQLEEKPWGNYEFGFYDPDKTPFFFYVDI